MGAWGPRSFDNDSAHDWLAELDGIRSLRATLERVIKRKATADIDVDDASAVIAAAEVIAAARGHAPKDTPEQLTEWVAHHGDKVTAADAKQAASAIARVQKGSELQELWADHGRKNPWTREVAKLLKRLAAKPIKRAKPRGAKAARGSNSAKAASKRKKLQGIEVPEMRIAMSPDGTLRGSVTSMMGMCTVVIEAEMGGGSVCAAMCDFDAMTIHWIDDATLEVTYPAKAGPLRNRDDSWYFMGRTVAIRYVTT
jgi:hypothetical protein